MATLTFTANDGVRSRSAPLAVVIRAPTSQPLELPAVSPNMTNATGDIVNVTLPEASEGETPYIYSAAGLPPGVGFRNRRAQGIPRLPGVFNVSYVVSDSNQDMVTRTFTWTITGTPIPQPTGINVRIDWGAQFYSNVHSNVTGRITSDMLCERGRATASSVLARSQAGQMTFDLQNADGLFDEENPSSPLAGLIRPGIQVQLRDGVRPLWTGVPGQHPDAVRAQRSAPGPRHGARGAVQHHRAHGERRQPDLGIDRAGLHRAVLQGRRALRVSAAHARRRLPDAPLVADR